MYYVIFQRRSSVHRISEYEKENLTASNNSLFSKLFSLFSESQLNEIDMQGKYIEIKADSADFDYRIKEKPVKG